MRIIFFALFIATVLLTNSCQNHNEISFPNSGFDFPRNVSSHDSTDFFYPLRNILSRKDSFMSSQWHYNMDAFDEPNLSIKPSPVPTVRFTYEALGYPVVINLVPNKLIIKQAYDGNFYPIYDTLKLSSTERIHFRILKRNFPLDSLDTSTKSGKRLDSMVRIYPQLKSSNYYNYLLTKAETPIDNPLKYHTKEISISNSTYSQFINAINESDFWNGKLKRDCVADWTDGAGYILEINTGKKYNVIFSTIGCPSNETKITKVCQDIINLAGLGKEIHVYNMEIK